MFLETAKVSFAFSKLVSISSLQTPPLANPRLVGGIQESDYLLYFMDE